jgi:hypothetical protein
MKVTKEQKVMKIGDNGGIGIKTGCCGIGGESHVKVVLNQYYVITKSILFVISFCSPARRVCSTAQNHYQAYQICGRTGLSMSLGLYWVSRKAGG